MKRKITKKIGFIAIEVVLVASILLAVGFVAVNSFSIQTTSAKDALLNQFATAQLNLGESSGELTNEQLSQLRAEVLSAISIDELSQSVVDLINLEEIEASLVSPVVVEQIRNEVLNSIDMDELSQLLMDQIDLDEIEATLVSPEMVAQITDSVMDSINVETLSQAVLEMIDIKALESSIKASILASIATNADTLDGFDSSYFATRNNPTFTGVINTGGQLRFPAIAVSSSDVNTLDDYEEGTFIPTFVSSSTSYTYTAQSGVYTKIGRQVTVSMSLTLTKRSGGTNNDVVISGLPFPCMSGTEYGFSGQISIPNSTRHVSAIIKAGSSVISLYDNSNSNEIIASNLNLGTYNITLTYFTN